MNRPPHHLADHAGDELLSAHLDDAVDGDERSELDEHLAACDMCRARLEALGRHAGDLQVEPLDDVTRRRLVSGALDAFDAGIVAARRRNVAWWRSPRLAAAAVVALLGTFGLTAMLSGDGTSRDAAQSAAAIPAQVIIGDVGSLDDPEALRGFLRERRFAEGDFSGEDAQSGLGSAGGAGPTAAEAGEDDGDGAPAEEEVADAEPTRGGDSSVATPNALAPSPDPRTRADAQRCLEALREAIPDGARVALVATGTFESRSAVALVLDSGDGRFLAFVAARDDCSILTVQSFAG